MTAPTLRDAAMAALPDGWVLNHAQELRPGAWEAGYLDEEGRFSPVVTVDTGLYYRAQDAEPMARAIVESLAAPEKPAPAPQHAGQAEPVHGDALP